MAAPVISISSDSFEESVGSHAPRVILFHTIPAIIPIIPEVPIAPANPIVAPEVGTVYVISPTRVLHLVDYSSSSDSDPSKDSIPVAPELPLVSPFLCTDDTRRKHRRLESFVERRLGFRQLVNRRVEEALAAYEATHVANALEAKSQSQNGSDRDNGNGGNGNGGNGNSNDNDRGARPVARECTYQDFMKCEPLNFKGTEGVVRLISALTWWNSHKRTIETDAAFAMSWRELMKLMAEVYCPRNEIQKMESEL
ncbi:hypothetical protein Tco_0323825 [Tanacetum coccineum]